MFINGSYSEGGRWRYITHPQYAQSPLHYIRAFRLILKDMQELFDYVEPADKNLKCYSYRTHELLLRACVEVEANCKAILVDNGYPTAPKDMKMKSDYSRINVSHRLSSYEVRYPVWSGTRALRTPFAPWATGQPLPWYQAYNTTKHDRHTAFEKATFEQVTDAIAGLFVLLSAQFWTHEFRPSGLLLDDGPDDGMVEGIGEYLRLKFPTDWHPSDQYNFKWENLEMQANPFSQINFTAIAPAQTV